MNRKYRRILLLEEKGGVERKSWPLVVKLKDISNDVSSIDWGSIQVVDEKGNLIDKRKQIGQRQLFTEFD